MSAVLTILQQGYDVFKISNIFCFDLTTPPTAQQHIAIGHTTNFSEQETGTGNFTNL